uniref:Uncharacterized protein n=1 Tax=Cacopsylla melanoneura TaxID=428564 RepID=A0A8D8VLF7_9HEMI
MGGILCVTPKSAVVPSQTIELLTVVPTAESISRIGTVEVQMFDRTNNVGLAGIPINELSACFPIGGTIVPSATNLLWLYSKYNEFPDVGGWNGFLEEISAKMKYEITYIDCQPFINGPPSDLNTVYTALLCSVEKTQSLGQVTTFVTFDQPLYFKARDVLASRQGDPKHQNVVIRLGGFHLLMSYMGAIGFIMEGSGLAELFNTIYAEHSTQKVMTGHAYARAVRAYLLAHRALSELMFEEIDILPDCELEIEQLFYGKDRSDILTTCDKDCTKELTKQFKDRLQNLISLGPTAKLWGQYFQMVTLMINFITAERTGNWKLHLETVYQMLPYFHSSGHYLYAKCGQL